jgi:iron complex outermembrane receptor protein
MIMLGLLAVAQSALADDATVTSLSEIKIVGQTDAPLPSTVGMALDDKGITPLLNMTSDTARLLDNLPGVTISGAGGVSSLPAIHGLSDDRLRIQVDGMNLISACANHMNSPLSYIDPANVAAASVFAGVTPVSAGGDSIGGTIQVDSAAPEFASDDQSTLHQGSARVFYRSNNAAKGASLSALTASKQLSLRYTGATVSAEDYRAGGDFKAAGLAATDRGWLDANEVGSSRYKSTNHAVALAMRQDLHLLELKVGLQRVPYQGFPNQRMDMTANDSTQVNLHYAGSFEWGALDGRIYREHTRHSMNFGDDKQFWYGDAPGMPMETEGHNTGAILKGDVPLSEKSVMRAGVELQRYRLDDWWPPSGTGMMMSPNTFWNVNNGQRDRQDLFAEVESKWNSMWVSQVGMRAGTVKMDTGDVQGYGMSYNTAATAFNAADHQKTDSNFDLTLLGRYTPDNEKSFEAGLSQKSRSPNLYERFAWSNSNTMVMNMNNWIGDGNGYVGNLNLKPEVAHTLSLTGNWHDAAQEIWDVKVSPYYTRVQDYIDAVSCTSLGVTCPARADGFVNLTLDNQSARLYGVDASARRRVADGEGLGRITAKAKLNYVNGKNLTSGDALYNIMPINLTLSVEQQLGHWDNRLEAKLVHAKTNVQDVRQELKTAGYGVLNAYSSYDWQQIRLDMGIENLLNKLYTEPTSGAYLGQGATMGTGVVYGTAVPAMGRSINTSVTMKF